METTLNIDDTLMAELKREAARQGRTVSELAETALQLLFSSQRKRGKIRALPKFRSGAALRYVPTLSEIAVIAAGGARRCCRPRCPAAGPVRMSTRPLRISRKRRAVFASARSAGGWGQPKSQLAPPGGRISSINLSFARLNGLTNLTLCNKNPSCRSSVSRHRRPARCAEAHSSASQNGNR